MEGLDCSRTLGRWGLVLGALQTDTLQHVCRLGQARMVQGDHSQTFNNFPFYPMVQHSFLSIRENSQGTEATHCNKQTKKHHCLGACSTGHPSEMSWVSSVSQWVIRRLLTMQVKEMGILLELLDSEWTRSAHSLALIASPPCHLTYL